MSVPFLRHTSLDTQAVRFLPATATHIYMHIVMGSELPSILFLPRDR